MVCADADLTAAQQEPSALTESVVPCPMSETASIQKSSPTELTLKQEIDALVPYKFPQEVQDQASTETRGPALLALRETDPVTGSDDVRLELSLWCNGPPTCDAMAQGSSGVTAPRPVSSYSCSHPPDPGADDEAVADDWPQNNSQEVAGSGGCALLGCGEPPAHRFRAEGASPGVVCSYSIPDGIVPLVTGQRSNCAASHADPHINSQEVADCGGWVSL